MKNKIAMNLQLFAEPTGGTGSEGGTPPAGGEGAANRAADHRFDYEKWPSIVAGKQSATEETVLKGYFKQQGLSQQEAEHGIATFKQQKAQNTPDAGALQQQVTQAQAAAQQANIKKEAMFMAGEPVLI